MDDNLSIEEHVQRDAGALRQMGPLQLIEWGRQRGVVDRPSRIAYRTALDAIGVDFKALRRERLAEDQAEAAGRATASVTFHLAANTQRWAICTTTGKPVWWAPFHENERAFDGSLWCASFLCAKRAVQLAARVRQGVGASGLKLVLLADAANSIWTDEAIDQRAVDVAQLAQKLQIALYAREIPPEANRAIPFTATRRGSHSDSRIDCTSLLDR